MSLAHAIRELESFKTRGLTPSFWVMAAHAGDRLRPLAETLAKAGCRLSVYNHGGWGGRPANMVAGCEAVNLPNVGIVYNLHHGHDHLPRFAEALARMLPHLHFPNLNGMTAEGDKKGQKILVLGQGDLDVRTGPNDLRERLPRPDRHSQSHQP
jgi:hypothetical protein